MRPADELKLTQPFSGERGVDSKLWRLSEVYQTFGEHAVEAIRLGLSRRIRDTVSDIAALIDEWERRDPTCCYPGSVEDLLSLDDTLLLAISYRHSPRENWYRKGPHRICKFSEEDEVLLKAALRGLSRPYLIIWCDQVVSTRLKHVPGNFPWFHIGLLPYVAFPVLQLSEHIPEEVLERRVWIRAERSLGRSSCGFLPGGEAITGSIGMIGGGEGGSRSALMNISKNILSGYWPEGLGYWADDYNDLKRWALNVLCRGCNHFFKVDLFQGYDQVDNTEILLNLPELASIPREIENQEPMRFTSDKKFYLKASAWNLKLKSIWDKDPPYISHYMGQLKKTRFSWWRCNSSSKLLFGCLADYFHAHTTTVLALENQHGYLIFRRVGDLSLYRHAEKVAGADIMKVIKDCADKARIVIKENMEWRLVYCADDCVTNVRTTEKVIDAIGDRKRLPQLMIPSVFRGMTTKLYESAVAVCGGREEFIARWLCERAEEWSEHVKRTYPEWVAVVDTAYGPVWLEGFDGNGISFGFLEFLTDALVLGTRGFSSNRCNMAKREDVLKEIKSSKGHLEVEQQIIVEELFGSLNETDAECSMSTSDIARFVLSGGFSNNFLEDGMWRFLTATARARGYWTTTVICRGGKMQIRFLHNGNVRIAQRATEVEDCSGVGLVRPADFGKVFSISEEYDVGVNEGWWEFPSMDNTTTKEIILDTFQNSTYTHNGKEILLVDMTSTVDGEEERLLAKQDLDEIFDIVSKEKSGELLRETIREGLEIAEEYRKHREMREETKALIEMCRNITREGHEFMLQLGMKSELEDANVPGQPNHM